MALALYRKYRPRTFAEVIGQEHVTEPLSQALRSGRLHHAYLFSGPRGCGKTSSARILARSLNCEQGPTPEPCGACASCRSLANDGAGSIDVIEIDAASHGGVDDARELREKAFFAPASSRYKVYVIDEAHMVSPAGFNALLKLVEEPPDYVKFIFATTEPEKVLGTIRSRTHHYPFRLIPPAVLRPYLQQLTEAEGVHVEPAVFPLVVRAGGGSARDTLSVLDQLIAGAGPGGVSHARAVALLGVTDVTLIDEMCDALAAGDGAAAYSAIDRVAEAGHDPRRFASDLLERFRDLIVLQQVPDAVTKGLIDGPADQLEAMSAQAIRLGPATLSRCADIVHNGLVEMRGTTAPRLLLELITARMLLPGAEDSTGALLQRLERMERRLTLGGDLPVRGEVEPVAAEPVTGSSGGLSAARAAAAAAGKRTPAGRPAVGPTDIEAAEAGPPSAGESASPAAGPDGDRVGRVAAGSPPPPPPPPPPPASASEGGPVPDSVAPDGQQTGGPVPGSARPVGVAEPTDHGDEPPWDDEPELDSVPAHDVGLHATAPRTSSEPRPAPAGSDRSAATSESQDPRQRSGWAEPAGRPSSGQVQGRPEHRAEPAGVLPDAPEEPGAAAMAGPPGQLTAAAVREVWPEIVVAVGRQSKKVSALAAGATVRDLDGQTVILTFRYPAHAKMVAPEAPMIASALYEALGGEWQVRCEVAGEAGAVVPAPAPQGGSGRSGPAGGGGREPGSDEAGGVRPSPSPSVGAQQAQASAARAPQTRRREAEAPSSAGDDDWPEPARPGEFSDAAPEPAAVDGEDWPEVSPIGAVGEPEGRDTSVRQITGESGGAAAGGGWEAGGGRATGGGWEAGGGREAGGDDRNGEQGAGGGGDGGHGSGGGERRGPDPVGVLSGGPAAVGAPSGGQVSGAARSGGRNAGGTVPDGGVASLRREAPAGAVGGGGGRTGAGSAGGPGTPVRDESTRAGRNTAPGSGLAAARAAAAGARNAATRQSAKPAAEPAPASWSDGSPTEEAPYDPEFDGASSGGVAAYDGFDPGDEPLDDVIDEKTARNSSEQQAMRLLQDAFGAEKIGES